jgi:hypothetical protein
MTERSSKSSLYPELSQTLKEKPATIKRQSLITDYYKSKPKSLPKEMKDNIKSNEYYQAINEYEQMIAESELKYKKEQKQSQSQKTLSNIFSSSLLTAKKHLFKIKEEKEEDSIIKINRWKDKIIELIYNFTISTIKCDTIEECNEIIDVINDILYSFIIRPNTMTEIISEKTSSSKDIYNYRRYRIFIKYLNDYKTKLYDNDLLNPEYIKSSEELKQILEKTKLFKNDFCINKFLSS